MSKPYLDQFFLVGGTALALQMGHRISVDLDLFTVSDFDQEELLTLLETDFEVIVQVTSPSIFITIIEGVKVDFVRFRYKLLFPVLEIEGIRMLDVRDIAPMKLDAVAKRGNKKDFLDIFYLLEKVPLPEMLDLYNEKFQHSTLFHIIKSLTFFDDAEEDVEPRIFDSSVNWAMVKRTIQQKVRELY